MSEASPHQWLAQVTAALIWKTSSSSKVEREYINKTFFNREGDDLSFLSELEAIVRCHNEK